MTRAEKKPADVPADIIEDMMMRVIDLAPQFRAAVAQLAAEVRKDWAGEQARICYIARHNEAVRSERNDAIRRDYLRGERIAYLSRHYKLSERRILQIVKAG